VTTFSSENDFIPLKLHFAMKGEKRLRAQSFGGALKDAVNGTPEMILAYDGQGESAYLPENATANVTLEKQPMTDQDPYCNALGLPISDAERASVTTNRFLLPTALEIAECEWKVQPTVEIVDGAECHVLESNQHQRIWVDPAIGFAVRFREIRFDVPGRPSKDWPLSSRFAFQDYRREDDIWLPTKVEVVSYPTTRAPENLWNQPTMKAVYTVDKLAVNDSVQDSLFKLTYPKGTMVYDKVAKRAYRIGDNNEELDYIVEQGSAQFVPQGSQTKRWFFVVLNIVVVVGLIVILAFRAWTRSAK
jgi:hypothetical protein